MNRKTDKRTKSRRWFVFVLGLVILVVAMPGLLARSPLRDRLLAAVVDRDDLSVSSRGASFGYFSPVVLHGLQIDSRDQSTHVNVAKIQADRSWVGLLFSRSDLGRFQIDRPSIDILVREWTNRPEDLPEMPAGDAAPPPKMIVDIRDASFVVRTPSTDQPPIDLKNIHVTAQIDTDREHSVLRVHPLELFDHQEITPELCSQGLQLVAPMLDRQLDTRGEFSLRFSEFQLPLGEGSADRRSEIRIAGELELHEMSASVKNPLTRRIAVVALKLIGTTLPTTTMIAEGVNVRFHVLDGRVHHQGLALLIPRGESSIEITSNGSVGLDESLDLEVEIQLPPDLLGESPLASKLTSAPVVLAIKGTLDDPEIGLPEQIDWVRTIETMLRTESSNAPGSSLEQNVADVLGQLIKGALERDSESEAEPSTETRPRLPNLRDWLRSRRKSAEDSPASKIEEDERERDTRVPSDI